MNKLSGTQFISLLNEDVHNNPTAPNANLKGSNKLGYVKTPGVLSLSFSRMQTLHSCPRKFLLREIHQRQVRETSIHMAFGSAWGAGIAELFRSGSLEKAWVVAFTHWDHQHWEPEEGSNVRGKSLWEALHSIEIFYNTQLPKLLQEWELAYIDGKPAIELLFYVKIGDNYDYQGHIDLILKHIETQALAVWELKTSGLKQSEAMWGNSDQGVGYYVILEHLQQAYGIDASPQTVYLVNETDKWSKPENNYGINYFPYQRSTNIRAEFINNILADINTLELYMQHDFFPKRGKSCFAYNRACEFYGTCDLATMQDSGMAETESAYEALTLDDVDLFLDMSDVVQTEQ